VTWVLGLQRMLVEMGKDEATACATQLEGCCHQLHMAQTQLWQAQVAAFEQKLRIRAAELSCGAQVLEPSRSTDSSARALPVHRF
jgi:hypothetical protein